MDSSFENQDQENNQVDYFKAIVVIFYKLLTLDQKNTLLFLLLQTLALFLSYHFPEKKSRKVRTKSYRMIFRNIISSKPTSSINQILLWLSFEAQIILFRSIFAGLRCLQKIFPKYCFDRTFHDFLWKFMLGI